MKRFITTAALAAIALAMCTSTADAGGKWRKRMAIAAIGMALLGISGPAFAGGYDNGPYYGPIDGQGPYGWGPVDGRGYVNGGGGYRPPPPRAPMVPVEPAFCDRQDTVYVPRFDKWMCRPVPVPRGY